MKALGKTYDVMHSVSNIICRVLEVLVVLIVVLNAGTVLLQVVNRYIIVKISDHSFAWTEELARYSLIWLCYIALPLCMREGSMAQLDIIYDRLGERGRFTLYVLTRILMVFFLYTCISLGYKVVLSRLVYKSSMLRAPGFLLYSAPVVGCILTAYEVLTEFVGVLAGKLTPFIAGTKRDFPHHNEPDDEMGG